MSDDLRGRSAYVLEKTYSGQMDWSLFFVYSRREHIRALLQDMFVDNPDPDVVDGQISSHDGGETADLWLIEHGRRTGHVDLRRFIQESAEGEITIDWPAFDAAVPAALAGPPLRHGEELQLRDVRADFQNTTSELLTIYPDDPVSYGMQVWVEGDMSGQPYEVFTDPDPKPA
ncbi:hypothetical protein ABT337_06530 [Saccharopolyspora hirsuta]|uniref:hypothetical protein n=1 Tax=Saccharopolyspora hirsuta TaxID=1837 RepID=UPI00331B8BA5